MKKSADSVTASCSPPNTNTQHRWFLGNRRSWDGFNKSLSCLLREILNEILNGDNLLSSQRRRDRRASERKGEDARFRPVRGADDPVFTRVVHTTRHVLGHAIHRHRVRGAISGTRRVAVHRHGLHLCGRLHHVHQIVGVKALVLNAAAVHRHREVRRGSRRHARRPTAHDITHVCRAPLVRRRRRPARVIRRIARRRPALRRSARQASTRRHTRVFPARRRIDARSDEQRGDGDGE